MSKKFKALAAIIFMILFGILSINLFQNKRSYLVALKKIDYESIEAITVFDRERELPLTSRRKDIAECLKAMKPGLIRGGDEVISIYIELQDGGLLNNNLVVFHTSKTIVFGYGGNSFSSPSRGIKYENSSFTGTSKCMYSAIYG